MGYVHSIIMQFKQNNAFSVIVTMGLGLDISKGPNTVGISFPSSVHGNRSSLENIVLYNYNLK
jgi:hypothetical protein